MSAIQLRPVNKPKGENRFCGPAAISCVTGLTTGNIAEVLRNVFRRRMITGLAQDHLRWFLGRCGIKTERIASYKCHSNSERPSLAKWLATSVDIKPSKVYIVVAGNHYSVIQGDQYCCGLVGDIINVTDKRARRRAKVLEAFELSGTVNIPAQWVKGTPAYRPNALRISKNK
jgi:hypothetical protein